MKSSRRLEKIIRIFLHGISIVFAFFLLQGGALVIRNLPNATVYITIEDYISQEEKSQNDDAINAINLELDLFRLEENELLTKIAGIKELIGIENQKFENILSSRYVTEDGENNIEVEAARKKLETEQANLKVVNLELHILRNKVSTKETEKGILIQKNDNIYNAALKKFEEENFLNTLLAFLIRLAFVIPLLIISIYLFRKFRKSNSWPFVYGLGYFSIYAFFFELVPYLPSYGEYVRSAIGIVLSFIIGRFAIKKLQIYLAQKRKIEKESESDKRFRLQNKESNLESTYAKINKLVCPSCDRSFSNKDDKFCVYCGLCLKNECEQCHILQNSFNQFCFSCGKRQINPLVNTEPL